jgi:hypothetical protein
VNEFELRKLLITKLGPWYMELVYLPGYRFIELIAHQDLTWIARRVGRVVQINYVVVLGSGMTKVLFRQVVEDIVANLKNKNYIYRV